MSTPNLRLLRCVGNAAIVQHMKKDTHLHIRISEAELNLAREIARASESTMGAAVRKIIVDEAIRLGVAAPSTVPEPQPRPAGE